MKKRITLILIFVFSFFLFPFALSAQFTITPTVTDVSCPGGNNGTASVSVTGGTAPYTFSWLDAGQTTQTITGLSAGDYSITITDNALVDSTIVVTVSQPQPILDNAEISQPYCTANGSIVLKTSGGTSPYSYAWSIGETIAGILNISEGNYSVIITDANSCTAGFTYVITDLECAVKPDPYFTPNSDGINDTWTIINSSYFPDADVIVFDRWGTKVFEHEGLYDSWNGKSYLGIQVPDGVYYYFFYRDKKEKQKDAKHGSVTIIR